MHSMTVSDVVLCKKCALAYKPIPLLQLYKKFQKLSSHAWKCTVVSSLLLKDVEIITQIYQKTFENSDLDNDEDDVIFESISATTAIQGVVDK